MKKFGSSRNNNLKISLTNSPNRSYTQIDNQFVQMQNKNLRSTNNDFGIKSMNELPSLKSS